MKKVLLILLIVVILTIALLFFWGEKKESPFEEFTPDPMPTYVQEDNEKKNQS